MLTREEWGEWSVPSDARQLSSSMHPLSGETEMETWAGSSPNRSCRIVSREEGSGFVAMVMGARPGTGWGLVTFELGMEQRLVLLMLFGLE